MQKQLRGGEEKPEPTENRQVKKIGGISLVGHKKRKRKSNPAQSSKKVKQTE